jgi:hypothetical protein
MTTDPNNTLPVETLHRLGALNQSFKEIDTSATPFKVLKAGVVDRQVRHQNMRDRGQEGDAMHASVRPAASARPWRRAPIQR